MKRSIQRSKCQTPLLLLRSNSTKGFIGLAKFFGCCVFAHVTCDSQHHSINPWKPSNQYVMCLVQTWALGKVPQELLQCSQGGKDLKQTWYEVSTKWSYHVLSKLVLELYQGLSLPVSSSTLVASMAIRCHESHGQPCASNMRSTARCVSGSVEIWPSAWDGKGVLGGEGCLPDHPSELQHGIFLSKWTYKWLMPYSFWNAHLSNWSHVGFSLRVTRRIPTNTENHQSL